MNKLSQFRIPTILGLAVIVFGTGAGIYLTLQQQTIRSKAAVDQNPKNIQITNVEDTTASVIWTTDTDTAGFVDYGVTDTSQLALDDLDTSNPTIRKLHHVTLKNLVPQTKYQIKIVSGETNNLSFFTTAPEDGALNNLLPIVGTVIDGDQPLKDGLVTLQISGAFIQSTVIKTFGSFIIPISKMRTSDLTRVFTDSTSTGVITVTTPDNQKATATISLNNLQTSIGPLKIGQDLDLTKPEMAKASATELSKFDLNGDNQINVNDYAAILDFINKKTNPASRSAELKKDDLNGDGVVDKKDLQILQDEINKATH